MGSGQVIPVVIDTNVLVSALLFGGDPGRLVAYWKSGRILPYISKAMVEELLRVLSYPKLGITEKDIQYLLYAEILPYFNIQKVKPGPVIIETYPSDDKFLCCAAAAGADAVISGDKHLLQMRTYQDIVILSPAQFF
jgi:putative PIN family toxin of toxin-antitoxin system